MTIHMYLCASATSTSLGLRIAAAFLAILLRINTYRDTFEAAMASGFGHLVSVLHLSLPAE